MTAYYNEFDPQAAEWLRQLIRHGAIAPGDVDERSIADVQPEDLKGYAQCHFFAGIGGWSRAARLAGVPDDEPIWTGSCPCPPFSTAGKGSECPSCGGKSCLSHPLVTAGWICLDCGDEWRGDDRHLLPEFFRLIGECRPSEVFGEQVASRDGRMWVYTLRTFMEKMGYAVGIADLCAAGFGAPHIRQRLYFGTQRLADSDSTRSLPGPQTGIHRGEEGAGSRHVEPERLRDAGIVADTDGDGCEPGTRRGSVRTQPNAEHGERAGGLGDADSGVETEVGRIQIGTPTQPGGNTTTAQRPDPTSGFWSNPDWLGCRDGKFRPVEAGTFPLADGLRDRVGLLRGYGNAIVPQVAAAFIKAVRDK